MNYSDFIYDFNLYLCERFGYRNCCSVMHNANGICISVHVGEMDLYIRFWEYSCGVGSIPDWSIIIVLHIPADTRSAFPVISVHSPVSIQYRWQS